MFDGKFTRLFSTEGVCNRAYWPEKICNERLPSLIFALHPAPYVRELGFCNFRRRVLYWLFVVVLGIDSIFLLDQQLLRYVLNFSLVLVSDLRFYG